MNSHPVSKPLDDAAVLASRFPTAYTILFVLIAQVAILTWIIPAGQYDRVADETVGRSAAVAGTYAQVPPNPQGPVDVLLAPIAGFCDPAFLTAGRCPADGGMAAG